MQKIKYFLLGLLVIAGLAYGGIKAYLYYSLKSEMDQLARQFSLFGQLEYGGLSSSVNGSLSVHDLKLQVHGMNDELRIKTLRYQTPNLWYLLQDSKQLEKGRIPQRLSLSIKGLTMDLFGEFTDRLEEVISQLNFQLQGINPLCGGRLFFGPSEWRDMGYEEISGDMHIGYQLDAANARIIIDVTSTTRDMAAVRMQGFIEGVTDTAFQSFIQPGSQPHLGRVTLNYTDQSYTRRQVEYCAGLSQLEVNEYVEAEANQKPVYYGYLWGIVPGPGLRQAYRAYLSNPEKIDLSFELPDSVTPETVNLFKPEDIPGLLSMKLSVNGDAVNDLSFSFYDGRQLDMGSKFGTLFAQPGTAPTPPPKQEKKIARYETRYHVVSVSSLKKYLGEEVRFQTSTGQQRKGFLVRIGSNVAQVEQRLHGGKFTMQVPVGSITKAEVLLTKRAN
jgi:hypothetical protein